MKTLGAAKEIQTILARIEGINASDKRREKLMYLIIKDIAKKWTMPMHNWGLTISQLYIRFGDRLKLERDF